MKSGFSLEQTRTAVEAAIDGVLRDREFGVDLFRSDLHAAILVIEGVSFTNVTISGHTTTVDTTLQTDKLDADGNLIIDSSNVITPDNLFRNDSENGDCSSGLGIDVFLTLVSEIADADACLITTEWD